MQVSPLALSVQLGGAWQVVLQSPVQHWEGVVQGCPFAVQSSSTQVPPMQDPEQQSPPVVQAAAAPPQAAAQW